MFLQKILLSFTLLGVIRQYDYRLAKPLEGLASSSFSIFFLHCYVLDIIVLVATDFGRLTGHYPLAGNPMNWLITFAIGVGVSYGIAVACQRLLGTRSRYLIGSEQGQAVAMVALNRASSMFSTNHRHAGSISIAQRHLGRPSRVL